MIRSRQFIITLALFLGSAGIALLIAVTNPENAQTLEQTPWFVVFVVGLLLLVLIVAFSLLRSALMFIWQVGVEQMRLQALAEHHRFLRRLDHELKNPLTALRAGMATLILMLNQEDQVHLVHTLADQVQRLSRLVTDLRKLAEIDALALEVRPLTAALLCEEIAALISERNKSVPSFIRLECEQNVLSSLRSVSDLDLILLAVNNLLDNACKYARSDDTITVTIHHSQRSLMITVQDTGIGIAEDEQPFVWEELYRGRNASHVLGSGIGLSLVRKIAERHNGQVELYSRLGSGTKVTICLPLV